MCLLSTTPLSATVIIEALDLKPIAQTFSLKPTTAKGTFLKLSDFKVANHFIAHTTVLFSQRPLQRFAIYFNRFYIEIQEGQFPSFYPDIALNLSHEALK